MACWTIRPAQKADYPAILALARLVAESGDSFPWEADVSDAELALYWLPEPEHRAETFVCDATGGGILGAYALHPATGGRGAHVAHGGYMVTPAARGGGIAKAMCSHSLQQAKQQGYVGMRLNMVVATNAAAVRAFTACGFKIMCTLPNVFRHPQRGLVDAHIMFHTLEEVGTVPIDPPGGRVALAYPAASGGVSAAKGQAMQLEPKFVGCGPEGRLKFTVQPALPEGLQIDGSSGVIGGSPVEISQATRYRVVATLETEVTLQVDEQQANTKMALAINEDFATRLETVTDVADLMPEPAKSKAYGDWMIWMVHRAWLNDPALAELNFNNMHMPPAHIEERIAPKLMQAILTNTHIESLSLSNSNVQKPQAVELAVALQRNTTLRSLNLECNWLDSSSVRELALAIRANPSSKIEHLRFSHQKQMGQFFGRPTEEAVGQMMEKNETVVKLGFECDDAHWRNLIDRALLRNNDYWRRRNSIPAAEEPPPAEERTLGHLSLQVPPEGALSQGFSRGRGQHVAVFLTYVIQNRKLPTTSQLLSCAKNTGVPLPYTKAAPLIRECRSALLNASRDKQVTVHDAFGTAIEGTLRNWSELNDHYWSVDIWADCGKRIAFRSSTEPSFGVSKAWADQLEMECSHSPQLPCR